ncbi:hypothetical protein Ciccas_006737 [Cichlidogyrus casuarinus]|uniref:Ferrochelatase n=1 Tax=Cichlidogyrus casuarinus TaxID=1844966 RepID=A0ABD2Q4W6_9PLAT
MTSGIFSLASLRILKLSSFLFKARQIVRRRTPKIIAQYEEIGGGSPITKWTETQGKYLEKALDKLSPNTAPHKAYIGFRYVNPLTEETINAIEKDGCERAVFFSQYQQYSCTTSGSSVNAFVRHYTSPSPTDDAGIDHLEAPPSFLKTGVTQPVWSFIDRWPVMPKMVKAFAQLIRQELDQIDIPERDNTILLFSAHSIPIEVVDRGDTYPHEVAATVYAVMQELGFSNSYRLVWQSKVGPKKWLGPATKDAIPALSKLGYRHAILVPIAFTSDHIETLYELDKELCEEVGKEAGMVTIRRAKALNDTPLFLEGLSELVADHLKSGKVASKQYFLRCPGCVNKHCGSSRQFLKAQEPRLAEWTAATFK